MSSDSGAGRREPGRVVQVFSDGRVVVDLGRSAGVNDLTRLILVRDYDEMTDADGDSLGRILNPKADLSVVSVDERFCVTYAVRSFADTLRTALPFLSADRAKEPRVGDEVVFADDWDL